MKYLIFGVVIAFVLEDYGTYQAKAIANCTAVEQIDLFNKYALDLVLATFRPLHGNTSLMDGGCECRLDVDEHLNPVDLAVETMCMVKNYDAVLDSLRDKDVAMDYRLLVGIRRVLLILENSSQNISSRFEPGSMKKYMLKYNQCPSSSYPETSDEEVDLAMKCYSSLNSFEYNNNVAFFNDLYKGFDIASRLMREDVEKNGDDSRWGELNTIIDRISSYRLHMRVEDFTRREFKRLFDRVIGLDLVRDDTEVFSFDFDYVFRGLF